MSAGEAKPQDADAAKRQRERCEALAARSPVRTEGRVALADGRHLAYDVQAEFVPILGGGLGAKADELQAAVFMTAYTAKAEPGRPPRPLCFAFNGGPGSASIWLHLGALGPKRVKVNDDGSMPAPPYAVVDNPLTWLAYFDIVFVDPPHTGWSITASDEARKAALSVDGDAKLLCEALRGWLGRHKRFSSALYIAGESYGTTRGAAIADGLAGQGIALAGVILVSCAMDIQTLEFQPRNDLPHALYLPAYANTAQYHGLLKGPQAASSQAAREAAEAFVLEDYLAALHQGARLSPKGRERIERRMAELTGLPRSLIEQRNLRIPAATYFTEAMREQGRIVGRLESRVTGPMAASRDHVWEFDPGIEAISAPYAMAGLTYFAELGLDTAPRYELLNGEVNQGWDWSRGQRREGFASTSNDLARAMRRLPHLKVFMASGRYDLGTPYSATDWTLSQLDAPAEVLARLTHRYYDAGHMMYTREADLRALFADLGAWLAG